MSSAPRRLALLVCSAAGATAIVLIPSAAADPEIDTESAAAVIEVLREQGYDVEINGVPSGDTALLTNCTVTAIHHPGDAIPETTTVRVDIACPIRRG